ncbi:hypothetical protein TruAng_009515 [Truncatella angustata]|nr:hypothetical protein TruAng_009515 [Truncatella angustata]
MCSRKNRSARVAPTAGTTCSPKAQRTKLEEAPSYRQPQRRGCRRGDQDHGGIIRMIVSEALQRGEARQAELAARNAAAAYELGYQNAMMEQHEKRKEGEDSEEWEVYERASVNSDGLGEVGSDDAPPPSYEMVQREEKGL